MNDSRFCSTMIAATVFYSVCGDIATVFYFVIVDKATVFYFSVACIATVCGEFFSVTVGLLLLCSITAATVFDFSYCLGLFLLYV